MSKTPGGPPPKKRATLRTISELTGLSQSTISLSLRGGTTLKEETRKRIAEAAASVGYVPDRAGVRLRTGKTNVVALVLDGAEGSIDFARHMIQGIGQAIQGTRYHMNVMPEFAHSHSVDTVRYILENRTADGIILTHTSTRDPRVQLLMDSDFPFVTHGRTEFFSPHPYHDFHSEAFARLGVERLASLGCRSVMLVIGGDQTNNYHTIVTHFERAASRLKLETRIVGTGRHLPLSIFGAKQFSYGVRARVWGRAQIYRSAFVVDRFGGNVFKRTSKARFPIEQLWGPAVPVEMLRDEALAAWEAQRGAVLGEAQRLMAVMLNGTRIGGWGRG